MAGSASTASMLPLPIRSFKSKDATVVFPTPPLPEMEITIVKIDAPRVIRTNLFRVVSHINCLEDGNGGHLQAS